MTDPRQAWIALNMMSDIGPVRVRNLIEALGSVEAIFDASESALLQVHGMGRVMVAKLVAQRGLLDPKKEEDRAIDLGLRLVTRADADYPSPLKEIHDPPMALYVRGTLEKEDRHGIAIIGSRRCSHYGLQTADRLAFGLVQRGWCVISGLARGIDAAGHEGALKGKGRTLAVLGCGADQVYPTEHAELAEAIAASGAVISEFPLGTAPSRTTFPMRNRIVSGLSAGVLMVEGAPNSGAMITCDEALAQGRQVFAVPGRIDHPGAMGPHRLIKQGAKLVESVDDITEEFEYLLPGVSGDSEGLFGGGGPQLQLSAPEEAVLMALDGEAMDVDQLARVAGQPIGRLNGLLIGLEMKKAIRMLPGRVVEKVRD